jgi:hypothetical protein
MWNGARGDKPNYAALKTHIGQINERLGAVSYRIVSGAGAYRLERIG